MKGKYEDLKINIGSLNFNTPFNLFIKNICHETLDNMIMHKNTNDKNMGMKENGPHKLTELIEKIMINMYETTMGVEYNPFKNKFVKKSTKGYNDADSKCDIF